MSPRLEHPRHALERRRQRALGTPNVDGSLLEGFVEFPVEGSDVERRTVVTGWHTWDGRPVAAVAVELDGRLVGGARRADVPRTDVAAARGGQRPGDGYEAAGWVADLDLRGVHAPTVTLRVVVFPGVEHPGVALDARTVRVLGEPTIDLEGHPIPPPDEVRGRLDVPVAGAVLAPGPVLVRGWARCTSGSPIARVALSVDGRDLGLARLGLDRADVAVADDAVDAPVCGFEQVVDLSVLGDGPRTATLRATAVALDGTSSTLEVEVEVEVQATARPRGASAAPPRPASRPRATGDLDLLVVTHDLGLGGAQLWLREALDRMGAGRRFPARWSPSVPARSARTSPHSGSRSTSPPRSRCTTPRPTRGASRSCRHGSGRGATPSRS